MESDLLRIFDALEKASVRYLVVGGVAVVLHGHLRVTADVDLVVGLESENVKTALRALSALGFRPRAPVLLEQFADAAVRRSWVEDKGLVVFSLWNPATPGTEIDIFVEEPFDFDAVYQRAVKAEIEGVHVTVVSIDDLIALKRAAGRDKDQDDVRALLSLKNETP
jgi:hypothetical protein